MCTDEDEITLNDSIPKVQTTTSESFFEQPINTISVKIKDLSNLGHIDQDCIQIDDELSKKLIQNSSIESNDLRGIFLKKKNSQFKKTTPLSSVSHSQLLSPRKIKKQPFSPIKDYLMISCQRNLGPKYIADAQQIEKNKSKSFKMLKPPYQYIPNNNYNHLLNPHEEKSLNDKNLHQDDSLFLSIASNSIFSNDYLYSRLRSN